jgi:UDP-N-acetyl-D-mannosaminuronate dehydrogenase
VSVSAVVVVGLGYVGLPPAMRAAAAVEAFYQGIAVPTVPVSPSGETELAKLIENTCRACA